MRLRLLLPLPLILLVVGAHAVRSVEPIPVAGSSQAPEPRQSLGVPPVDLATETSEQFAARQQALEKAWDWKALLESGHARRLLRPQEAGGWFAEATGAFMRGDVDTAIASWEAGAKIDPSVDISPRLNVARLIRQDYPALRMKPLEFVEGDAAQKGKSLRQQARQLLAAKSYDQIERVASTLQKSKQATVLGTPHLEFFFDGLSELGDGLTTRQSQLAAWQVARPQSNLARLAAISFWTARAQQARGGGWASTITPEGGKKMEAALNRAASVIAKLPPSAFDSPLAFTVLLEWARLAGPGRGFLDKTFAEGTGRFPDYQALYSTQANLLRPRWYGEPGDWQAMVKARADRIGGEAGDIFYARLVMGFTHSYGEISKDEPYDVVRLWRGLDALLKRHPMSITLRTGELLLGMEHNEFTRLKRLLSAPDAYRFDQSWLRFSIPILRRGIEEARLQYLTFEIPLQRP